MLAIFSALAGPGIGILRFEHGFDIDGKLARICFGVWSISICYDPMITNEQSYYVVWKIVFQQWICFLPNFNIQIMASQSMFQI